MHSNAPSKTVVIDGLYRFNGNAETAVRGERCFPVPEPQPLKAVVGLEDRRVGTARSSVPWRARPPGRLAK